MPGPDESTDVGPSLQQASGQDQQVVERQLAAGDASMGGVDHQWYEGRHQTIECRLEARVAHRRETGPWSDFDTC